MPAGRPSIGVELHERVESVIRHHPELGYHSTAELVKDLLRRWLEDHEDDWKDPSVNGVVRRPSSETDSVAGTASAEYP